MSDTCSTYPRTNGGINGPLGNEEETHLKYGCKVNGYLNPRACDHIINREDSGTSYNSDISSDSPQFPYCSVQNSATYKKSNIETKIYCVIVFSFVSLLISITSGVLVTLVVTSQFAEDAGPNDITCVSCDLIKLNDEETKAFRRTKGNKCCADNAEQFEKLMSLVVQTKLLEERIKIPVCRVAKNQSDTCSPVNRHSAHVTGTQQPLSRFTDLSIEHPVLSWISKSSLAFTDGVIFKPDTGRIVVTISGRYVLYSHATFTEYFTGNNPINRRKKFYSHSVYRYNRIYPNGGSEKLMQERETKCWSKDKDFEFHSSHLTGMFHLMVGDELYVKVCNISTLSRDPMMTYFGMFMIN